MRLVIRIFPISYKFNESLATLIRLSLSDNISLPLSLSVPGG